MQLERIKEELKEYPPLIKAINLEVLKEEYTSEKRDYYIRLPALPRAESLNIYSENDDSDNDIYINESEDEDLDELQAYLSEKRQNKQLFQLLVLLVKDSFLKEP
ncbi:hypothetical protein DL98DRAFT_538611 [Cadophora sp. DSE1049]|nr:hypothetical protein DL98DRAFT_538611 [Cadophora sp. DSE1049]